jgi:hypothetical protein
MSDTPFLITIDAEGDDLWARPRETTTRNALYLPRFQSLCERFRFKPVYLTDHDMAMSDAFVEFGCDVLRRGTGEIGMHLHAWNSPPLYPLTSDDLAFQPYLIEYPEPVMKEKISALTHLLEDRFDRRMVSHRAGRWALDGRYAEMLLDQGYRVDCSVTPGIDWGPNRGDPRGSGGVDYTAFPTRPYFLDRSNISVPTNGGLLEVPVTIHPSALYRMAPWVYRMPLLRRVANRVSPGLGSLCPSQPALGAPLKRKLDAMLAVARRARAEGASHLEFMLHSSELMPGGSPTFRNASDIDCLYEHLEVLFQELAGWCSGVTLEEFATQYRVSAGEIVPIEHMPPGDVSSIANA